MNTIRITNSAGTFTLKRTGTDRSDITKDEIEQFILFATADDAALVTLDCVEGEVFMPKELLRNSAFSIIRWS